MFTGVIETIGKVIKIVQINNNIVFSIRSSISSALKVDQSIAHNGVCLTITALGAGWHSVVAIYETLSKTNLDKLVIGDVVNLERCLRMNDRLDGHLVQGHIDRVGICKNIIEEGGSWRYTFAYEASPGNIVVQKGAICVNGVSLTVARVNNASFQVAIIPYTYENTTFQYLKIGDCVNLEFDIIGKYLYRLSTPYKTV